MNVSPWSVFSMHFVLELSTHLNTLKIHCHIRLPVSSITIEQVISIQENIILKSMNIGRCHSLSLLLLLLLFLIYENENHILAIDLAEKFYLIILILEKMLSPKQQLNIKLMALTFFTIALNRRCLHCVKIAEERQTSEIESWWQSMGNHRYLNRNKYIYSLINIQSDQMCVVMMLHVT